MDLFGPQTYFAILPNEVSYKYRFTDSINLTKIKACGWMGEWVGGWMDDGWIWVDGWMNIFDIMNTKQNVSTALNGTEQ